MENAKNGKETVNEFLTVMNTARALAAKHGDAQLDAQFMVMAYAFGYSMATLEHEMEKEVAEKLVELLAKIKEGDAHEDVHEVHGERSGGYTEIREDLSAEGDDLLQAGDHGRTGSVDQGV